MAGKTFYTAEEAAERARATGRRLPTEAEQADALRRLGDWNTALRSKVPGTAPVGGRFSDDLAGTEYDPGTPEHAGRDTGE
jgi:formylglycine-generating enzyme required for sulfatase activity